MMPKRKNEDVSNKAVVLMLVSFILISVVSLGVYMDALESADITPDAATSGQVYLTIEEAPDGPTAATPEQSTAGQVSLNVLAPPN